MTNDQEVSAWTNVQSDKELLHSLFRDRQVNFVFDKRDFTDPIDIEHLTPALLAAGGKRDVLTEKVVLTAVENIQTFCSTGVFPENNYDAFIEETTTEEEGDIEITIADNAKAVIDRLVNNAQSIIMELTNSKIVDNEIYAVEVNKDSVTIKCWG